MPSRASYSSSMMEDSPSSAVDGSLQQRHRPPSLTVQSFSAFRAQTPSIPGHSPVRRKPLPSSASARGLASPHLTSPFDHGRKDDVDTRPYSSESITPQNRRGLSTVLSPPLTASYVGQDLEQSVHNGFQESSQGNAKLTSGTPCRQLEPHMSFDSHDRESFTDSQVTDEQFENQRSRSTPSSTRRPTSTSISLPLNHDRHADINVEHERGGRLSLMRVASDISTTSRAKSRSPIPSPRLLLQTPDMVVFQDGLPRSVSDNSLGSTRSNSPSKRKHSPTSKFSSFFGWKSSSPRPAGIDSPTTTFSERSGSPVTPAFYKAQPLDRSISAPRLTPTAIDIDRANSSRVQQFDSPSTPFTVRSASNNAHVEELERELREVSSELAGSIRREMELEDEIERCKMDVPHVPGELARRTSDYFSDSGASATKYPLTDSEAKVDELEKTKRKLEQEKGLIRSEYSTKIADEMKKRRELESRVHQLERDLQERRSTQGAQSDDRVRELETFLEESRRRLSQERQSRDNFEDLLAALRSELAEHRNDRDNLRDEIVPQLKSRIEGLETEAAEVSTLRYENTRMQQEIHSLRGGDGFDTPGRSRNNSIGDDLTDLPTPGWTRMGLGRSGSLLSKKSSTGNLKRGDSLRRTGSTKGRQHEEPVTAERMKDTEDQRDALHHTLRSLLRRHEQQQREHAKAIQRLIVDREQAKSITAGRNHFTREVTNLREEIVTLRKRADEALEQKWQLENNFGGVKMALDRAHQETNSLRAVLAANDQSTPHPFGGLGISIPQQGDAGDAQTMIKVLRRSITQAENERNAALREAAVYRERVYTLPAVEAEQLAQSANKMEELAARLQQQVETNIGLHERLAQAVGKGERQQSASTQRVVEMQSKLKAMEEAVMAAQQQSESTLEIHDEEARALSSAGTPQVQRLTLAIPSSAVSGHRSPSLLSARSPQLNRKTSATSESLFEASKTAVLQQRVRELEQALADADAEMQSVVEKIESSQYEIAELQGERDEATRQMRKLQSEIHSEKDKAQRFM